MDKPSKFWGKASEWKDWSDGFVAFASAAHEALSKLLLSYQKKTVVRLRSEMDEEETP